MSERYSRLFSLSQNLYTEDAPVLVAAGALLKDNQTGKVLAQLKIQSITEKTIKAAKVQITPFDTVGNPLDGTIEKEFLDLSVARDDTFGQKTPVFLPNASTRGFSVRVTEVAFADNTVWQDNGSEWKPLIAQSELIVKLKDPELVKQYQLSFGAASQFIPAKERDLWLCTCGHINHADEETCAACGVAMQDLRSVDFKAMQAEKQARLAEEAKRAQEAEKKAKATKTKAVIAAAITVPLVIALIIFGVWFTKYSKTKAFYNEALSLAESGKAEQAIEMLESIVIFKDSSKQIKQIQYQLANSLYENKKYGKASELFESLGNYEDSAQMAKYVQAFKLLTDGEIASAVTNFIELDGFKYSAEQVKLLYDKAKEYQANKDYENAVFLFEGLGDYEDSSEQLKYTRYSQARDLIGEDDDKAREIFMELGNYKSAKKYVEGFKIVLLERSFDGKYTYNRKGQIIKKTYSNFVYTYEYDENGNKIIERCRSAYSNSAISTTRYTYDTRGNCVEEVYIYRTHTSVTNYTYNAKNQCVTEQEGSTKYENSYNEKGQLIQQIKYSNSYPNKVVTLFEYDKHGNIVKEQPTSAEVKGMTPKLYNYQYDDSGRVIKVTISYGSKVQTDNYYYGYAYVPEMKD